jgi:hypothetical protein
LLLLCVSITFTATASSGGGGKDKKVLQDQQDPNRRQSLLPKLDGEPENGGFEEYDSELEADSDEEMDQEVVAESDSTQSSFRKFNFIFYFLYKFKYENDSRFGTIPQELESN